MSRHEDDPSAADLAEWAYRDLLDREAPRIAQQVEDTVAVAIIRARLVSPGTDGGGDDIVGRIAELCRDAVAAIIEKELK